jgi:hypothetical protein
MYMKKYKIQNLLKATEQFSNAEGANEVLEASLREIQAKKEGSSTEAIIEVDEETLFDALAREVPARCLGELIDVVLAEYKE